MRRQAGERPERRGERRSWRARDQTARRYMTAATPERSPRQSSPRQRRQQQQGRRRIGENPSHLSEPSYRSSAGTGCPNSSSASAGLGLLVRARGPARPTGIPATRHTPSPRSPGSRTAIASPSVHRENPPERPAAGRSQIDARLMDAQRPRTRTGLVIIRQERHRRREVERLAQTLRSAKQDQLEEHSARTAVAAQIRLQNSQARRESAAGATADRPCSPRTATSTHKRA